MAEESAFIDRVMRRFEALDAALDAQADRIDALYGDDRDQG